MNCLFKSCITVAGLLLVLALHTAAAQSNQEWITFKQNCGLPASLDYNSWVASGSKCNSGAAPSGAAGGGLTPQQQLGAAVLQQGAYMFGEALHNWLFGEPQQPTAPLDPVAQQRALAAQQLNNSGNYLLKQAELAQRSHRKAKDVHDIYASAINEFQQALENAPGDPNISANLALARRLMKDTDLAAQNSIALSGIIGTPPADTSILGPPPANAVNPANPLSLLNLDSNVVDLSGAAGTSVNPTTLQGQIDNVFKNRFPAAEPPDPRMQMPQVSDIDLLFDPPPPSAWPGPHRPESDPKLVNNSGNESSMPTMNDDLKRQVDWFNKVYLPAHPEVTRTMPVNPNPRTDDGMRRQMDWFYKVYLPAHPEVTNTPLIDPVPQPHN
jgi:hypothetical protein